MTLSEKESKLMAKIVNCYCGLSPENLWCDGEASPEEAHATGRRLQKELKALFKELGRTVSEGEAFQWWSESRNQL